MAKFDVNIWMPLYIGDLMRDTAGMTAEMIGSVVLLYLRIWSKDGPLPDNNEKLGRICQMSADRFEEIRDEISSLFDLKDGDWTHNDLLAERTKWVDARIRKSEAAKTAANLRWDKEKKSVKDQPGLKDNHDELQS